MRTCDNVGYPLLRTQSAQSEKRLRAVPDAGQLWDTALNIQYSPPFKLSLFTTTVVLELHSRARRGRGSSEGKKRSVSRMR